jgi:hypothetical protein
MIGTWYTTGYHGVVEYMDSHLQSLDPMYADIRDAWAYGIFQEEEDGILFVHIDPRCDPDREFEFIVDWQWQAPKNWFLA